MPTVTSEVGRTGYSRFWAAAIAGSKSTVLLSFSVSLMYATLCCDRSPKVEHVGLFLLYRGP